MTEIWKCVSVLTVSIGALAGRSQSVFSASLDRIAFVLLIHCFNILLATLNSDDKLKDEMTEVDKEFCFSWPFGVLKTLHVAAPFATLVTIYLGPYKYAGIGFVQFVAWTFFFANLFYLILYLFNVHKRNMAVGQLSIAYIPLALTDFCLSCFGTLLFLVSALICLICIVSSIEHRTSVTLTYLFAFIFTSVSFLANAYYAILIYRGMPNGKWKNLQYLIISGREILLHPASGLASSNSFTHNQQYQQQSYRPPTGYVV